MSKSDHSRSRNPKGFYRIGPGVLMSDREAVEEGIIAHLDMDERAQFTRECDEGDRMFEMYAGTEPLAEWEWELLRDPTDTGIYADYLDDFHGMLDERTDAEDLAHYGDPANYVDHDEEDLDSEDPSAWLAIPSAEFFDAVGNAFVIEGPTIQPEPIRAGHYRRVWELARETGVPSKALVDFLRVGGEYVKTHQSYVAEPVCERILSNSGALRIALGTRAAWDRYNPSDTAVDALRERLLSIRPGTNRPWIHYR